MSISSFSILLVKMALLCGAMAATAVQAQTIYVTTLFGPSKLSTYSILGAPINASLISDIGTPEGIALDGQSIYLSDLHGTVGKYTTAGAVVDESFATGNEPFGVAVSDGNLYVTNYGGATLSKYTTSGALVKSSLIPGLNYPGGLAVVGTNLFLLDRTIYFSQGKVGLYTTSGLAINASLISGLNTPSALAVSGTSIFVASLENGTIGSYTTSGAVINASLITGLNRPTGIAIFDDVLYVTSRGSGTVGAFTLGGAAINRTLISGLNNPSAIAIASPIPEPASYAVLAMGLLVVGIASRPRRPRRSLGRG